MPTRAPFLKPIATRRWLVLLWAGFFLLALPACTAVTGSGQAGLSGAPLALGETGSLGQTFTAGQDGLNGIRLYLAPREPGEGTLHLRLFAAPGAAEPLAAADLPADAVTAPGWYDFTFPAQPRSLLRDYYLELTRDGGGEVAAGAAEGAAYMEGSAYVDRAPAADAQLAFLPHYAPGFWAAGLALQALGWLKWLALAGLLFVLPGWALLSAFHPGWARLDAAVRTALAAGVSLGLYPLLFLWADLAGLHPGAAFAWLPAGAALLYLAVRAALRTRAGQSLPAAPIRARLAGAFPLPQIALWAVLGLFCLARFYSVRLLQVPMWGDAYQHTAITQLMLDHGGLFSSWQPYVPYASLTVQFGFPAYAALLAWAGGASASLATLWAGQILNVLAVLSLVPLATRLARGGRWAGVGAVLVAGLLLPIPNAYTNWGRYAQLGGQAILPIAAWLLWDLLEDERFRPGKLVAAVVSLAGMVLTYYRMPFYYAAFGLMILAGWALPALRGDARRWAGRIGRLALVAALGVALVLPWLARVKGGALAAAVETGMTTAAPGDAIRADYAGWQGILQYVPLPLLIACGLAWLWALAHRRWEVAALALWVAALAAVKAGQWINLPGANLMQSFAVLIALYIPAGLLLGWWFDRAAGWLEGRGRLAGALAAALLAVAAAGLALRPQVRAIQPATYALVTRPDLRAMDWIRTNTPAGAHFLVEGFRIYDGRSAVGSDAGWWIPLLAGRANSMPPQYALLNEAPEQPGYSQAVVDLVAALEDHPPGSPAGLSALCDWGITHVYVGQRQGSIGAGAQPLFPAAAIADDPAFEVLYQQDRVTVAALKPTACAEVTR